MSEHTSSEKLSTTATEPAQAAEVARVIVAVLVALGWITVDATTLDWIISAIGLIVSVILTYWTRRLATPIAKPRAHGRPLVPAAPPSTLRQPPPGDPPPTSP